MGISCYGTCILTGSKHVGKHLEERQNVSGYQTARTRIETFSAQNGKITQKKEYYINRGILNKNGNITLKEEYCIKTGILHQTGT